MIVDDGDGGSGWNAAVTPTGAWGYRTEGQHGGSYLDTGSHFGSGENDTATYAVSLPEAGLWSVETWTGDTLQSTPGIQFTTASGTESVSFDQAGVGNPMPSSHSASTK